MEKGLIFLPPPSLSLLVLKSPLGVKNIPHELLTTSPPPSTFSLPSSSDLMEATNLFSSSSVSLGMMARASLHYTIENQGFIQNTHLKTFDKPRVKM